PFIVIVPGVLGLAVLPYHLVPQGMAHGGLHSYNDVLPLMLARYCGPGLLGLGVTALIAGFMSGMAGNVSAFATVWTYDIYRPFIRKNATDKHYLSMGRWCTIVGVLLSIGAAYTAMSFTSIMDYVQALFSFFIAPLFATVILGMLWKRTTSKGAFWGLLVGTVASIGMFVAVKINPGSIRIIALSPSASIMAENVYRALWSWIICVVITVVVSMLTQPRKEEDLVGLVYGCTELPSEGDLPMWKRPIFWAAISLAILIALNIIFW
ncbi:MAG: sodium:solute symporter family transporter, partial [Terriglobia bacterium]